YRDLTLLLFAYYDFAKNIVVIEDEYYASGAALRTDMLAEEIKKIENKLFLNEITGESKKPYLRVADNNNLIMLNDLHLQHGILFVPTAKDNREAAINNARIKVGSGQVRIHPRCKVLIHHLK